MATLPIPVQPMPAGSGYPPEDFVHGYNAQGHFQLVFSDSAHAASWHNAVTMSPEVDPQSDSTIVQVQRQRVGWTATMGLAVYDLTICTDGDIILGDEDGEGAEGEQAE
jgi:hypothetical protein